MNSTQKKLIDLIDYVSHMIKLDEKPIFTLADYHQLLYHEDNFKNRLGIEHDISDDNGPIWLKIKRLKRINPPEVPEEIKNWITISRNPYTQPKIHSVLTETLTKKDVDSYLEKGIVDEADIQPSLKSEDESHYDVILRLDKQPDIKMRIDEYLQGPWNEWFSEEKPRRETIKIYEDFFNLLQVIQTQGVEYPSEIVWGIGIARWNTNERLIDHPLIEQLIELEIDTDNGSILLRPRGTEPQVALKPYFALDNPGAETVLKYSRDFFSGFSEDQELSPFESTTFTPILRQATSQLDKNGRYYPDDLTDITDRSLPQPCNNLNVTDTWAVYARQRSDNFFLNDLENLKDAVKSADELPGPSAKLVTIPSNERNIHNGLIDLGISSLNTPGNERSVDATPETRVDATQTHDFFFPKPFNKEQISIIKKLEQADGVVVQGPPGTGKTHTIANIICHCLATGKRVLVTAKTEAALSVLRNHIPEEIRELAISLLTNERMGLKQLESAVNILARAATELKPSDLERDIITEQERILELRNKNRKIDEELYSWADKHLRKIKVKNSDQGIYPIDLAKRVIEDKEQHSWLPDRPGAGKEYNPKFTDEDITSVRRARKEIGGDLIYLNKKLPSLGDLPDTANLGAVHRDLLSAEELEEKRVIQNIPLLSVSVPDVVERAEKVFASVSVVIDYFNTTTEFPWIKNIFNIWKKEGYCGEQCALFNNIVPTMENIAALRTEMVGYAIGFEPDILQNQDVYNAIERAQNGQKPFGFIPLGKSEARNLFQQIKIEGRLPESIEDWKKIFNYTKWRKDITSYTAKWNNISKEFDLPEITDEGENTAKFISSTINLISKIKFIIDDHLPILESELPRIFPYGLDSSMIIKSKEGANEAADAIKLNLAKIRLSNSRKKITDLLDHLSNCAGPIINTMKEFLTEKVGKVKYRDTEIIDKWQEICRELNRLHNLRSYFETVKRVAGLIRDSGGKKWAGALETQPVLSSDDQWTPGDWHKSWVWAQQESYLKQIDGRDRIGELSKIRLKSEEELQKRFQNVIKLRTFLGLKNNMTQLVQSSLVLFTTAIRRIGKGTGIRAQRFRRDAKNAMEHSYAAVPCWIMPTWRISESLPAELGSFDVVIVDEASQSDISALPALLRGKKVLVVGDDKQVSPTAAFVEEKKLLQLKHNYLTGQPFAQVMLPGASLYDLARAVYPAERILLREHFRCVEPIIRFSFQFYDEELSPLRIPKASERLDPPLIDVHVPHGRKDRRQINVAEAEAIVDEIEKLVNDPAFFSRSMGIISLIGAKQAQYIQKLLLSRIGEEAFLKHNIACGDSAIFQGKERDIMFLSMVECPDTRSTKTALLFQQRYNVALSRARDRMYLYRSVEEEMLNPQDLKAKVIRHFKNPMPVKNHEIDDLIELCDSDFEREVFTRLNELGYRVIPQVKVGPYSIDLVVEGNEDRRLAIELDGDQYHTPERWADDLKRQRVLERVGWRFWRCWGSSFALDPEDCMQDLIYTLNSMQIFPIPPDKYSNIFTEHRVYAPERVEPDEDADNEIDVQIKEEDSQTTFLPDDKKSNTYEVRIETPEYSGSEAYEELNDSVVEVGDRVLISYNDEPTLQYTIKISKDEHDPDMMIIRYDQPLAQALIDAEINEEVEIPAGGKTRIVSIIKIEKSVKEAA